MQRNIASLNISQNGKSISIAYGRITSFFIFCFLSDFFRIQLDFSQKQKNNIC